ncbi:MAG: hypothetical protein LBU53_09355 [Zoogloeaceae bacterium]|nr:hypothetical protein [Zoogloeaceae bacterium]
MCKFRYAVFFCAFLAMPVAFACDDNSNSDVLKSLSVQETSMGFAVGPEWKENNVITIGKIKNSGVHDVRRITLEIQYFDSAKRLIDVNIDSVYNLLKNDEIAFRLYTSMLKPQAEYVSQQIRITSASAGCEAPRSSTQWNLQGEKWVDLFVTWFPLLLIIGVWLALMHKYSGSKSPTVCAVERQIDVSEQQNKILERIANVLEEKNKVLVEKDVQKHDEKNLHSPR